MDEEGYGSSPEGEDNEQDDNSLGFTMLPLLEMGMEQLEGAKESDTRKEKKFALKKVSRGQINQNLKIYQLQRVLVVDRGKLEWMLLELISSVDGWMALHNEDS